MSPKFDEQIPKNVKDLYLQQLDIFNQPIPEGVEKLQLEFLPKFNKPIPKKNLTFLHLNDLPEFNRQVPDKNSKGDNIHFDMFEFMPKLNTKNIPEGLWEKFDINKETLLYDWLGIPNSEN